MGWGWSGVAHSFIANVDSRASMIVIGTKIEKLRNYELQIELEFEPELELELELEVDNKWSGPTDEIRMDGDSSLEVVIMLVDVDVEVE
jgi:hypothetical protein